MLLPRCLWRRLHLHSLRLQGPSNCRFGALAYFRHSRDQGAFRTVPHPRPLLVGPPRSTSSDLSPRGRWAPPCRRAGAARHQDTPLGNAQRAMRRSSATCAQASPPPELGTLMHGWQANSPPLRARRGLTSALGSASLWLAGRHRGHPPSDGPWLSGGRRGPRPLGGSVFDGGTESRSRPPIRRFAGRSASQIFPLAAQGVFALSPPQFSPTSVASQFPLHGEPSHSLW